MQKLSGNGIVFLEFDGSIIEYDLAAGQEMVLDTGHLAAMEDTCTGENIYTDYASLSYRRTFGTVFAC